MYTKQQYHNTVTEMVSWQSSARIKAQYNFAQHICEQLTFFTFVTRFLQLQLLLLIAHIDSFKVENDKKNKIISLIKSIVH